MVKFRCESCSAKLGAPDEYAGKRVKCSKCGQPTRVPEAAAAGFLEPEIAPEPGTEPASPPPPKPRPAARPPAGLAALADADPATTVRAPAPPADRSAAESRCPKCGAKVNPGAAICINCGHSFKHGINVQTIAKAKSAAAFTGRATMGLIFASVAALIGAAIWAGIVVATGYEVGYVAWGLGLLVGLAVAIGWPSAGTTGGLTAAGFAALSLVVGKLLIFSWAAPSAAAREMADDPQFVQGMVLADMVRNHSFSPELQAKLDAVGDDADELPPDLEAQVQQAVSARINGMTKDQKHALAKAFATEIAGTISYSERLSDAFSPFDILWFLLALSTAFKVGCGMGGEST